MRKQIEGFGNNAEPIKEGNCCDECNIKVVIPERLEKMKKLNKKTSNFNDNF